MNYYYYECPYFKKRVQIFNDIKLYPYLGLGGNGKLSLHRIYGRNSTESTADHQNKSSTKQPTKQPTK